MIETCCVIIDENKCTRIIHNKSRKLCNAHNLQRIRGKKYAEPRKSPGGIEYRARFCTREDCNGPVIARGLCGNHYSHFRQGNEFFKVYSTQRPWGSSKARDAAGNKECAKCGKWLPESSFGVMSSYPDGLNYHCKECINSRKRHPRDELRDNLPTRRTIARYNKDDQWFIETLSRQGNSCAICKTPEPPYRGWAIDHDHSCCPRAGSCGRCVRGLLCSNCNTAIGLMKEDPERILGMIDYLKEFSSD